VQENERRRHVMADSDDIQPVLTALHHKAGVLLLARNGNPCNTVNRTV